MAKKEKAETQLNDQQEMFCREYLKDLNLTQAYMRAYPEANADTARSGGAALIAKPSISAKIQVLLQERAKRTNISADKVVQRLANIAFGDLGMICTWDDKGLTLKDKSELTIEERSIIESIDVSPVSDGDGGLLGYAKKVRMKDSLKALEMLCKHLGMFDGSNTGKSNKENARRRLSEAIERVAAKLDKRGRRGS